MSELESVFGNYTPEEIKAASHALSWAAKEIADTNNFTKIQTETLQNLLASNKDLQRFFTTAEPDGFAAMRDKKFDDISNKIIVELKEPIRVIIKEEIKKTWGYFTLVLTAILGILTYVFNWIDQNNVESVLKAFLEQIPK